MKWKAFWHFSFLDYSCCTFLKSASFFCYKSFHLPFHLTLCFFKNLVSWMPNIKKTLKKEHEYKNKAWIFSACFVWGQTAIKKKKQTENKPVKQKVPWEPQIWETHKTSLYCTAAASHIKSVLLICVQITSFCPGNCACSVPLTLG